MTPKNQTMYRDLMREIKYRNDFVLSFGNSPPEGIHNWTYIETISLQIRMMLENIALACLIANGDHWNELPRRIEKDYHAEIILKKLENINPDCYPQPLVLVPGSQGSSPTGFDLSSEQYRGELVGRPGNDWLTREEFSEVYGRLGRILHARNPMGTPVNFHEHLHLTIGWQEQIANLLSHHKVVVLDERKMYVVLMKAGNYGEVGNPSHDVQVSAFQLLE